MLSLGPWKQGSVSPRQPEEQGLGARAGCPAGQRRREAAGEWSGKAEKGQARRRYFNLINDRIPLRVCFNNQDTLQQVDRMFAVNLHMSSAGAVSINNVRECADALQPLQEPGRYHPCLSCCLGAAARGGRESGHFRQGFFPLGNSQVFPPK